jgi:hypothetical protein
VHLREESSLPLPGVLGIHCFHEDDYLSLACSSDVRLLDFLKTVLRTYIRSGGTIQFVLISTRIHYKGYKRSR